MNPDPGPAILIGLTLFLLINAQIHWGLLTAFQTENQPLRILNDQQHYIEKFAAKINNLRIAWILNLTAGLLLSGLSFILLEIWQGSWWWILLIFCCIFAGINESIYQTARRYPDAFFKVFGGWILAGEKLLLPLIWLVKKVYFLFSRKTSQKVPTQHEDLTAILLKKLIDQQKQAGRPNKETFKMIDGVISMQQKMAREVMVARTDAFMVDIKNDNDRNIDAILQQPYSRVPVYNEDKDNIVGIVHIKNLLRAAREEGFEHLKIRRIMQPALFIPETLSIDKTLFELKRTHNQMAILFDEYGGVVGLVTLEDLIEEIVGEISDESDRPDVRYQKLSDSEYLVEGKLALDDFNEEFKTNLQKDEIDTIAGYMIAVLGKIPADGQQVEVKCSNGLKLITERVVDSRILQVKAVLPPTLAVAHVRQEKQLKQASKS
jgi:putative hemolysin